MYVNLCPKLFIELLFMPCCVVCVCVCAYSVFSPLLRLSPPPSEKDYYFNLDENEGVCDLFDIPL